MSNFTPLSSSESPMKLKAKEDNDLFLSSNKIFIKESNKNPSNKKRKFFRPRKKFESQKKAAFDDFNPNINNKFKSVNLCHDLNLMKGNKVNEICLNNSPKQSLNNEISNSSSGKSDKENINKKCNIEKVNIEKGTLKTTDNTSINFLNLSFFIKNGFFL